MGNIVAPMVIRPVNIHDTKLFYESFRNLLEIADLFNWNLCGSYMTLDSGFCIVFLLCYNMIMIKQNYLYISAVWLKQERERERE